VEEVFGGECHFRLERAEGGNMNLSPILLFAFNRPQSLQNCIESLQKNALAKESKLFIFVDGARRDKEGEAAKVFATQEVAKSVTGFESVTCEFSKENNGLANSIINEVSQVIEKYGRVIALEDDLILAPGFLDFINQGLEKYENEQKVFSVCGYGLKVKTSADYNSDAYFCTRSSSWGWATWKDRWQSVNWNVDFKSCKRYKKNFNKWGGSDCFSLLKKSYKNKIDSWAIYFSFSMFLQNKYSLHPVKSLVNNYGINKEATHTKQKCNIFKSEFDKSGKTKFEFPKNIELDKNFHKQFLHYYSIPMRLLSKTRNFLYEFASPLQCLSEYLYNSVIRNISKKSPKFICAILKWSMIKIISKYYDPIITVSIGDASKLQTKLSFKGTYYYARYHLYDRALPRICELVKNIDNELFLIDIGANIGDTAILVSEKVSGAYILCIDGNRQFHHFLKQNTSQIKNNAIFYDFRFCSDSSKNNQFNIETKDGTACLSKNHAGTIDAATLDDMIMDNPLFRRTNVLKIDTDGFEITVLGGAKNLLTEQHPVLYFEFTPDAYVKNEQDHMALIEILISYGYTRTLFYTNLGIPVGIFDIRNHAKIQEVILQIDNKNISYYDIFAISDKNYDKYSSIYSSELQWN
jgi:FkbM family methyltransferase